MHPPNWFISHPWHILGAAVAAAGATATSPRWLPSAVRFFVAIAIRVVPQLSWDYRHRRVKRRQPCVACGSRKKKAVRYDPLEKMVVVQCEDCMAVWGFAPVVQPGKWSKVEEGG